MSACREFAAGSVHGCRTGRLLHFDGVDAVSPLCNINSSILDD